MNNIYLLTGGNIGDRFKHMSDCKQLLAEKVGTIIQASSIYETAAWGKTDQAPFLNQVLQLKTALNEDELLESILSIELQMGRARIETMGPRIIDIDILFFNNIKIEKPGLVIPHPQIANRRFVLEPLVEIAPALIHPKLNKTIERLLDECPDQLEVKKLTLT